MHVVDLAAELKRLRAAPSTSGVSAHRFPAGHEDLELIALAPDRFWEERDASGFSLMLLEGLASLHLDDWRTTLTGGHLVAVPAEVRCRVLADGGLETALLVWRPRERALGLHLPGAPAAAPAPADTEVP
jgi:hypothetical protein